MLDRKMEEKGFTNTDKEQEVIRRLSVLCVG
jgi:hypothetical protein